jgi:hypothetical protein
METLSMALAAQKPDSTRTSSSGAVLYSSAATTGKPPSVTSGSTQLDTGKNLTEAGVRFESEP